MVVHGTDGPTKTITAYSGGDEGDQKIWIRELKGPELGVRTLTLAEAWRLQGGSQDTLKEELGKTQTEEKIWDMLVHTLTPRAAGAATVRALAEVQKQDRSAGVCANIDDERARWPGSGISRPSRNLLPLTPPFTTILIKTAI